MTLIREFLRYITARIAGLAVGSRGAAALLYLLSVMANIPVLSGFR
jgi:biotin transporter BioY